MNIETCNWIYFNHFNFFQYPSYTMFLWGMYLCYKQESTPFFCLILLCFGLYFGRSVLWSIWHAVQTQLTDGASSCCLQKTRVCNELAVMWINPGSVCQNYYCLLFYETDSSQTNSLDLMNKHTHTHVLHSLPPIFWSTHRTSSSAGKRDDNAHLQGPAGK